MPWSADDTIPSMKKKSKELRALFARVANQALAKGQSEEEAVFAGIAAVKNAEKKTETKKAVKPELPSHVKAILDSRKKQEEVEIEKKESQNQYAIAKKIVSVDFDRDGFLELVYDDGTRIKSRSKAVSEQIEQHVSITGGGTPEALTAMNEPTGFPNREDSVIDFDDATRTFTISPVTDSFSVWLASKEISKTEESIQLPNTSAEYFIYFDSVDYLLKASTVPSSELFLNHALVAIIYWRADEQKHIYFADERHGITMDGATHRHLHLTLGAQYRRGLALLNILVDQAGTSDSHSQFGVANGSIADEDLDIDIVNAQPQILNTIAQLPVFYRMGSGVNWYRKEADDFPLILPGDVASYTGVSRVAYNYEAGGFWLLDEVPNNQYVLIHVLATNDVEYPVVAICGNTYNTKTAARDGANTELATITGLPFAEFVRLGTVIYQAADSYINTSKTRIVSTTDGGTYIDYRLLETFTPLSYIDSGSTPVEIPANVVRGYYTEVSLTAYTPVIITHNLNLLNRNSVTVGATYLNQTVQIEAETIDNNSIRIETSIDVPLLCVTIHGLVAV